MTMWAMRGVVSRELISYGGRILVHDNPHEMEWLFSGVQAVQLGKNPGFPMMWVKDHPDLGDVTFPLVKERFRDSR